VTVTGNGNGTPHIFDEINAATSLLLQSVELPDNTTRVLVAARGNGVGLVQLNVQYNVYTVVKNTGLDISVNTNRSENEITLTACSKWLSVEQSGMVVMEINQLTGYSATNTDDFYNQMGATLKRIEQDDNKIVLYLDRLNSTQECIQVISEKVQAVNNVQNATVKVYRYYDPSGANLVFYSADEPAKQSWCDSCPQCCDNKVEVQTTVGSNNGVTTYATNATTSVSVLKRDAISAASRVQIFYHITIWALAIVMKFIN
jgi:CD109 antigen